MGQLWLEGTSEDHLAQPNSWQSSLLLSSSLESLHCLSSTTLTVKTSSRTFRCNFLYFHFCPCPPVLSLFFFPTHSTILCLWSNLFDNKPCHPALKKQNRSAKLPYITQGYPVCRGLFLRSQLTNIFQNLWATFMGKTRWENILKDQVCRHNQPVQVCFVLYPLPV